MLRKPCDGSTAAGSNDGFIPRPCHGQIATLQWLPGKCSSVTTPLDFLLTNETFNDGGENHARWKTKTTLVNQ